MADFNKTVYACKTITPMFIYGAKLLELRPAPFKGLLRYWWRALNGHLPLEQIREKEGLLFGSSDEKIGRSPIILRIIPGKRNVGPEALLPHRRAFPIEAFRTNSKFQIIITSIGTPNKHTAYERLLEAALLLGGLGRRARRGFGSIAITKKEKDGENAFYTAPRSLQDILTMLNANNNDKFSIKDQKIISHGFQGDYPYLKTVELGESAFSDANTLLERIGTATHKISRGGSDYTGFAKGKRKFASPIYITVLRITNSYHPLISTLNTAPQYALQGENKQNALKDEIL